MISWFQVYRINFQLYKILEMCTVVIMCIHWAACLQYYVPMSVNTLGTLSNELVFKFGFIKFVSLANSRFIFSSWVKSSYFLNKRTKTEMYLVCLHRTIVTFVRSAHYLNMKTHEDILLNLILTIIGFLGFLYILSKHLSIFKCTVSSNKWIVNLFIVAQFSQLMTTFYITIKRNLKIIQQLQEYMRYKELPYTLQRRLLTYYHYHNRKSFERNKKIIDEVSPYLREVYTIFNEIKQ